MNSKDITKEMKFRSLGGSYQLVIEDTDDIRQVLELDAALWAMTSIRIDSMVCDKEFLAFIDEDRNGKIRADEVKRAVRWMLGILKDYDGVDKASDTLELSAINTNLTEGKQLLETIEIILDNLGIPDAEHITLDQIRNNKRIMANSLQNGDGIVSPSAFEDPELKEFANNIMSLFGKEQDITGESGISMKQVDAFETNAKAYLDWRKNAEDNAAIILPFGLVTLNIHPLFQELRDKFDEFFLSCDALTFTTEFSDRIKSSSNTFDPLVPHSVDAFLEKSQIARANTEGILRIGDNVNPLWRGKIAQFFGMISKVSPWKADSISNGEWLNLKALLAPSLEWHEKKNTTLFDNYDLDKLRNYLNDGSLEKLKALIHADMAVGKKIELSNTVKKLILYQQNMLNFLNNFVCMHNLFDFTKKSMLQVGHLIMDGRHFSLVTLVNAPDEHKKIAKESNICVMYLTITTGQPGAVKTMSLAAAVTSGNMRNLFTGKSGIFITPDAEVWDAKVTDFIQQPVSISEAFMSPFYKFGEFIGKQADKFFSSRSKELETQLETQIQSTANQVATPATPQQTPAVSGSMLLMGGGLGIAALGSAFAFITKTLQDVSAIKVVLVLIGILLIFGGPVIIVSLVKLHRRNLAIFMEANGYALNKQMRLSRKMGLIFTFAPSLPKLRLIYPEKIVSLLTPDLQERVKTARRKLVFILLFVILPIALLILTYWLSNRYLVPYIMDHC